MTDEIVIVRMVHIRQAKMCSNGTRDFFNRHGLDWQEFLKEGVDAEKLRATGDAMALKVVKVAENGRR
jgi:hypothetical protein